MNNDHEPNTLTYRDLCRRALTTPSGRTRKGIRVEDFVRVYNRQPLAAPPTTTGRERDIKDSMYRILDARG